MLASLRRDIIGPRLQPWGHYLLLTLLLLPGTYPLWRTGVQATHDALHHLARLHELDLLVRAGSLYPRWFPHMGFLHGFPVLHYYAPLTYYLAQALRLAGWGYTAAYEWTLGLGLVASGWTMYGFARRWGEETGWLAALAYVYWPYHLANALVRGAQAELWAMVWYPLLLAQLHDLYRAGPGATDQGSMKTEPRRRAERKVFLSFAPLASWRFPIFQGGGQLQAGLALTMVYVLLMLTHNISAFFFTPVFLAYALLLTAGSHHPWQRLGELAGFTTLGIAISAFFWLPALVEVGWVRAAALQQIVNPENLERLYGLRDLLSPYWIQRYLPFQGTPTFHPISRVTALLWLLTGGLALWRWPRLILWQRRSWAFFTALVLLAVFMMHACSRPLWAHVPLVSYLGPPYRFQSLVALGGALTVALALTHRATPRPGLGHRLGHKETGFFAIQSNFAAPELKNPVSGRKDDHSPRPETRTGGTRVREGAEGKPVHSSQLATRHSPLAVGRFLAYGAVVVALALGSLPRLPQEQMSVPGADRYLAEDDMHLETLTRFDYQIGLAAREWGGAWFYEYLPVWVRESPTGFFLPPARPQPAAAPLDVQVTLGRQHPLDRTFTVSSPAPWTFSLHQFYFPAWTITVDNSPVPTRPRGPLGLLSADIAAGEHTLRVRYGSTPARRAGVLLSGLTLSAWLALACRRRARLAAAVVVPLLLLTAVSAAARAGGDGPFLHTPQNVQLGEEVSLVGSLVPRQQVRPGERLWVAFDWLARAAPQDRYKVILHLEDMDGRLWANGDAEPGFSFTPTTRWEAGEVMEDWHSLTVPADAPPGRYRLLTGMYYLETVENLPLQGGTHVGGRLLVAEIEVK